MMICYCKALSDCGFPTANSDACFVSVMVQFWVRLMVICLVQDCVLLDVFCSGARLCASDCAFLMFIAVRITHAMDMV